jgi:Co/Zn/Cd efflux system component
LDFQTLGNTNQRRSPGQTQIFRCIWYILAHFLNCKSGISHLPPLRKFHCSVLSFIGIDCIVFLPYCKLNNLWLSCSRALLTDSVHTLRHMSRKILGFFLSSMGQNSSLIR